MPDDPVIQRQEVIPRPNFGDPDSVVVESHLAPYSREVEGAVVFDPYKDADMAICRQMIGFLQDNFPIAYSWRVECDIAQGIAKMSIPVLMGINNWMVINLKTHGGSEFGPKVVDLAGQILERYLLPRDKYNLGKFLEARAQHSALVVPSRKVPA
jgi:hypothetical protein